MAKHPHRRHRRFGATALAGVLLTALTTFTNGSASAVEAEPERPWLDIQTFAEVPHPGHPEGVTVADDGTVYTATQQHILELPTHGPSKVFAYTPDGELIREYVIKGQDTSKGTGIVGMVQDADGILYMLDRYPRRVIALDPETGEQWDYATFHQVRDLCVPVSGLTLLTFCVMPDDLTFTADGSLYATDVAQNLIWRVPPGGGKAEVWFDDTRLTSVFGPNGIEVMPDGKTLMFAQSLTSPLHIDGLLPRPDTSRLYTLPIENDGSPGDLEVFWESRPLDGIDGFAIAESGNLYIAMALANAIVVVSPEGEEIGRNPANLVENELLPQPFDDPASVKFLGERVIVSNHTLFLGNPRSFVLHDVWAGEPGLPEVRPEVPRPE